MGKQTGIDVVPEDFHDFLVFAAVRHNDVRIVHIIADVPFIHGLYGVQVLA